MINNKLACIISPTVTWMTAFRKIWLGIYLKEFGNPLLFDYNLIDFAQYLKLLWEINNDPHFKIKTEAFGKGECGLGKR